MSLQRTPLRFALAIFAVACFGAGFAVAQTDNKAQTGLGWEMKATRAGIHVLDNPRPRPKTPAARLTAPVTIFKSATEGRNGKNGQKAAAYSSIPAFAPEYGMVLSGGAPRLSKDNNSRRLTSSLQDNQTITGGLRSYESSFGASSKTSSAPRRRLSSP